MTRCCICGREFEGYGNNPAGAVIKDEITGELIFPEFDEDDRCCTECNNNNVIPGRLLMALRKGKSR